MRKCETFQACHSLVDLGVVFHRARAKRIQTQVDVVVPGREPGEMADHIHLTQLRHAVDLAAQKLWVHQIAHLLKGHVQRRKIERTAPGRSLLEEQRFIY